MISIIIPVYNEEKAIDRLLGSFSKGPHKKDDALFEIIVVDGGSNDRTTEITQRYAVKLLRGTKNRALQMNEGAARAKGDILLFLHADSILDEEAMGEIEDSLRGGYVGGCLTQRIDSDRPIYRFIEASGNIRARISKTFYGDQAIFVRRDLFFEIGGFDIVKLFDDVIFSRKLKKRGKTCVLNKKVYTSPRRWENQGIIRATLVNWLLSIGFSLGVPPDKLKKLYEDIR